MATITKFEDVKAWQKSRKLAQDIYLITNQHPFSQDFALKNQIRSATGSIMDNIAEGFERGGNKEFIHFLFISKASAGEVRSQLYRALDVGYLSQAEFDILFQSVKEVSQMLMKFIQYLKSTDIKGHKFK